MENDSVDKKKTVQLRVSVYLRDKLSRIGKAEKRPLRSLTDEALIELIANYTNVKRYP